MSEPRPLIGIGLMLLAMAILPFMDVIAKSLGQAGMPILIVVWGRAAFSAALTLPFAWRAAGAAALVPERPLHHLVRAGFLFGATFCFFTALKTLPIADALAIFFVNPLVIVILSAWLLRESVGIGRWIAVAVGFVGTLIIIRPGFEAQSPGTFYALAAGVALGTYFTLTRQIAGQADASVLTLQTNLIGALLLTLGLPFVWVWPDAQGWLLLAGLGLIATLAHVLITRAYEHAEASLLAPLAFTEIVMAVAVGWWFFGDWPDLWTFAGVAILIGSAVQLSMRQRA